MSPGTTVRRCWPFPVGRCLGPAEGQPAALGAPIISSSWVCICIFGPWFTPHAFTTIYQDYNRVPPSLSSYPKAEMLDLAVSDAVRRGRVQLAGWEEKDGRIFITVTSAKPIDERMTRYIDRSSVFEERQGREHIR